MKTLHSIYDRNAHRCSAYSLIEMLAYIAVLAVIMGVGYAAVYRSMDSSTALRRNAQDIATVLRAGETWRADVRSANSFRIEMSSTNDLLHLAQQDGRVSYRFAENAIQKRVGEKQWTPVLQNVNGCTFLAESRSNIQVLRCEIELQPRIKRLNSIRPLFTFIAVPSSNSAP
jgi:type II secretory pathway pseudopilin PulG